METSLHDEVSKLIDLKAEGDYWDYKKRWHESLPDLLHDIICMANNTADHDGYIIIGVKDRIGRIDGVPKENRKSQQQLIDFLKGQKFAGDTLARE